MSQKKVTALQALRRLEKEHQTLLAHQRDLEQQRRILNEQITALALEGRCVFHALRAAKSLYIEKQGYPYEKVEHANG